MNTPEKKSPSFQCQCGTLKGRIVGAGVFNRVVCYCVDCQIFAKHLGCADKVLNAQGGTEIIQLAQPRLKFEHGIENLAIVKLSEKGLIRWYASCCNTPIGNTVGSAKFAFIGLIHSIIDRAELERSFNQDVSVVNPQGAYGDAKPSASGLPRSLWRILKMTAGNAVTGKYKESPLFDELGNLIVTPEVLSAERVIALKQLR